MAQKVALIIQCKDSRIARELAISADTLWYYNSQERSRKMEELKSSVISRGYLAVQIDSVYANESILIAAFYPGKAYHLQKVEFDEELSAFRKQLFLNEGQIVTPQKLSASNNRLLRFLENNGYPFAAIESKSIITTDSSVWLQLRLNKGTFFTYDTILVQGTSKLTSGYLANFLAIKKGQPYNESVVSGIDKMLDRLTLAKRRGKSNIFFDYNKVIIKLYLDESNTDRLDGIVGFAPNSNLSSNAILFTGEANLELNNLANRAIGLTAGWKSYLGNSQELNLAASYPYIFKTPLQLGAKGHISKFDTLFATTTYEITTGVSPAGNRNFKVIYGQNISSLLSIDTNAIRQSGKLPQNNPYKINRYGLALFWNQLDFTANPRSGFMLNHQAFIGIRLLQEDPKISRLIFYSNAFPGGITLYDTLKRKQTRGEITFDNQFFIPVKKQATLCFRILGNYLVAPTVYFNELYRLGGFSTLRGFDERSIFAQSFSMLNTEFRYLLNRESFAGLFVSSAYAINKVSNAYSSAILYSFGASSQIKSGNFLLQLSYAVGTASEQPLNFRTSKIHFGIINYLK